MHTTSVSRPRTISISRGLATTREDKAKLYSKDVVYGSATYAQEDVEAALKEISTRKEIGAALRMALTTYPPELTSDKIILPIENTYQEDALKNIKVFIQNLLKKELKNKNIELVTRVIKEKESVKLYITDKDKLERLVEKNPSVIKFIQTFGLELK
ncbi:MAG: hypothetical protein WBG43_08500 [Marinifilaceae bacterium]